MYRSVIRVLLPVLFVVVTAWAAIATTARAADQSIRLVTGNDYPPYTDESLPQGGLANEIVMRVYDRLGISYTIDWKPWKRGYQEGASGMYDATYPYVFTEERNQHYAYSAPIFISKLRLFMRSDSGLDPQRLEDAKGKRLCLPLGWAAGPEIEALFETGAITRDEPQDMETCFRLLDRGRTDYVMANEIQGWVTAKAVDMDTDDVSASGFAVETNPLYVIFSRQTPNFAELITQFDEGLAELRAAGEYDAIVRKHLATYGSVLSD